MDDDQIMGAQEQGKFVSARVGAWYLTVLKLLDDVGSDVGE